MIKFSPEDRKTQWYKDFTTSIDKILKEDEGGFGEHHKPHWFNPYLFWPYTPFPNPYSYPFIEKKKHK